MKKAFMAFVRPICRLIGAALWQLVWLIPLWGVCWYSKRALPQMIRTHFGVDQAQDKLNSLEQFAEIMKSSSSLSNPTALLHYISAQLSKFSAATKLSTLEITSNILQTLCIWGLNLIWIIALVYAVVRTIRLYRDKANTYNTALSVAHQLQPQLLALQQEISALREEIQELKKAPALPTRAAQEKLLTHE